MAMIEIYQRLGQQDVGPIDDQLVLDHWQREKGRFKAEASSGLEVRVFLERGRTLGIGEVLRSNCGKQLAVVGALEEIVEAKTDDWAVFSKACYHLGNRHVKLQIGDRWLRITPDHVLEGLLQELGLETHRRHTVFVPEKGAYSHRAEKHHDHHHH